MICQFAFSRKVPSDMEVIDCRRYMSNCFSASAARNSTGFSKAVNDANEVLKRTGKVAIGCHMGKHRSVAVAEELSRMTGIEITRI